MDKGADHLIAKWVSCHLTRANKKTLSWVRVVPTLRRIKWISLYISPTRNPHPLLNLRTLKRATPLVEKWNLIHYTWTKFKWLLIKLLNPRSTYRPFIISTAIRIHNNIRKIRRNSFPSTTRMAEMMDHILNLTPGHLNINKIRNHNNILLRISQKNNICIRMTKSKTIKMTKRRLSTPIQVKLTNSLVGNTMTILMNSKLKISRVK